MPVCESLSPFAFAIPRFFIPSMSAIFVSKFSIRFLFVLPISRFSTLSASALFVPEFFAPPFLFIFAIPVLESSTPFIFIYQCLNFLLFYLYLRLFCLCQSFLLYLHLLYLYLVYLLFCLCLHMLCLCLSYFHSFQYDCPCRHLLLLQKNKD